MRQTCLIYRKTSGCSEVFHTRGSVNENEMEIEFQD